MKKKLTHILLLCSLFFNITHATIIATEDTCQHESAIEYVSEQAHDAECGDLCELHHLFHFMAIIDAPSLDVETLFSQTTLTHKTTRYTPPCKQTTIKPPIA